MKRFYILAIDTEQLATKAADVLVDVIIIGAAACVTYLLCNVPF